MNSNTPISTRKCSPSDTDLAFLRAQQITEQQSALSDVKMASTPTARCGQEIDQGRKQENKHSPFKATTKIDIGKTIERGDQAQGEVTSATNIEDQISRFQDEKRKRVLESNRIKARERRKRQKLRYYRDQQLLLQITREHAEVRLENIRLRQQVSTYEKMIQQSYLVPTQTTNLLSQVPTLPSTRLAASGLRNVANLVPTTALYCATSSVENSPRETASIPEEAKLGQVQHGSTEQFATRQYAFGAATQLAPSQFASSAQFASSSATVHFASRATAQVASPSALNSTVQIAIGDSAQSTREEASSGSHRSPH